MVYPSEWRSGLPESPCGKGARFSETELIRKLLPVLVRTHKIASIADVGCGDQNWMEKVEWKSDVRVQGFDYVVRNKGVEQIDIVRQVVPAGFDMIQCVYVLNHLYTPGHIEKALNNFKESGIRWLFATQSDLYPLPGLGKPVEEAPHKVKNSGGRSSRWFYALWEINPP